MLRVRKEGITRGRGAEMMIMKKNMAVLGLGSGKV